MSVRERSLLSEIRVDHGPSDLLGRFFLKAEAQAKLKGVSLSFASFDDLVEINAQNRESWTPLIATFHPRLGGAGATNGFCIIGRDSNGAVVATQAARVFDWQDTNFYEEATSLRLFYADPERTRRQDEACIVTARATHDIVGRVVFSGGVWYRPDFRGRQLSAILPRICRAYAHTRWNSNLTVAIMAEAVMKGGITGRNGYNHVDWSVLWRNSPRGTVNFAFAWMETQELVDDLERFLAPQESGGDWRHRVGSGR
ncbi:MAG: hypothetical protein AB7E70_19995 [Hyphomicrobiaceae bacterium]